MSIRFVLGWTITSLILTLTASAQSRVDANYQAKWNYSKAKKYAYKKVTFRNSKHYQYLIYSNDRQWIYWFNPTTKKFWCACPTKHHQKYGGIIKGGSDLFLVATKKAPTLKETVFPQKRLVFEGTPQTKDVNGKVLYLGCPAPDDLPNEKTPIAKKEPADLPPPE